MELSGRSQASSGDTKAGSHCDPCLLLNKFIDAEYYCVDCDEFFCNSCSSVHKMSKLSRNHKLLFQDEMPLQKIASAEENVCSKHSRERMNYFCKVHNKLACTLCITLEHRHCFIQYIDEIAADFVNSSEYRSLREKISSLLQKLETMKKISIGNSEDLQTIHSQFVLNVKALRSEVDNLLDYMEATILKEAQDVRENDMKAAQTVSTACDTVTTDVNKIVTNLEKHEQYKQQRQLVISAKKAELKIKDYEKKMDNMSYKNNIRNYKLRRNQKVLQALHSINSLGIIVDKDKETDNTVKKRSEKKGAKRLYSDPKSLRAFFQGDIKVTHKEDRNDCWIKGSEMIDSYRIALIDAENHALKIVNVDRECIISYLRLPAEPSDVACIDESQLVVTCDDVLLFVNVGKTLLLNKEIPVYGKCTGIVFNDEELFVSFTSPEPVIKSISLNGEILKTFSTDKTGEPLFKSPSYICLSWDKSELFVTDCKTQTVIKLDLDGDDHTIYRHFEFGYPFGLTADKYGNVYAASALSKIYQISAQYRRMQIFHKTKQYPQSMTYCGMEDKLYISQLGLKRNLLTVYQLRD